MKTTLNETASHGPYLVYEDGTLYMAWAGTTNIKLNVITSTDGGETWGNKVTLVEKSYACPALLFKDGTLFMAWTGTDGRLNVISSSDKGQTWGNKITLGERSPETNAPWLMLYGDVMLMAWTGTPNDHALNLIFSSDNGMSWGNKITIPTDTSLENAKNGGSGPSLVARGNELIMAFTQDGRDNAWDLRLTIISSADGGKTWSFLNRLTQQSIYRPFLLLDGDELLMSWTSFGSQPINLIRSSDGGGNWEGAVKLNETASGGSCLVKTDDSILVGWAGTNLKLNIETVSSV